jgi:hypothetical protein
MMKKAALLGLIAGFAFAAPAFANDTPLAVLELFTSQGCSSCPEADRLAGEMARDENLVVLTFPVDYWDYLGWKDTLGSAAHSARQEAYVRARGGRGKFTPEMIVNGTASATGNDRRDIKAAIEKTSEWIDLDAVPIQLAEAEGQIEVNLKTAPAPPGEVWLFALASERTVEIENGENKNRTISYTNVVRKMTRLGAWSGKPAHFTVPRAEAVPPDADKYLVMVQEGSGSMPGAILGVRAGR